MTSSRMRERTLHTKQLGKGMHTFYNINGTVYDQVAEGGMTFTSYEKCYDTNRGISRNGAQNSTEHPGGIGVFPGKGYDDGGDLGLLKSEWKVHSDGYGTYKDGLREYEGNFRPDTRGVSPNLPGVYAGWTPGSVYSYVDGFGATAYDRFKPGTPELELGQFIAELRDIHLLFRVRLKEFKDLGSAYLQWEFGWKLFLRDLRNMFHVGRRIHARLAQLRRDNGAPVRRRGTLRTQRRTQILYREGYTYNALHPVLTTLYYNGVPKYIHEYTAVEDLWFSGSFRYWIPDIGSYDWGDRAVSALFGLNPTPSLLWEVLPFSWLIDWFANIGDVLSNISENAAESLVSEYAYLMRTGKTIHSYQAWAKISTVPNHSEYSNVYASLSWTDTTKVRRKATPFGFQVSELDLSARQLAILAALGLKMT